MPTKRTDVFVNIWQDPDASSGLIYPSDLAEWQEWQNSRRRVQRGAAAARGAVKAAASWRPSRRAVAPGAPEGSAGTGEVLGAAGDAPPQERTGGTDPVVDAGKHTRGHEGDAQAQAARPAATDDAPRYALAHRAAEVAGSHVVIGIDSNSPTAKANSLSILPYMSGAVSVLFPAHLDFPELRGEGWSRIDLSDPVAEIVERAPSAVVTLGHFLGAGAVLHRVAARAGIEEFVLQHGVLTPYAPPLPPNATLLAWSEADAEFWTMHRADVTSRTVGSQHLWEAAQRPLEGDVVERPVFLGQLHGAELPRRVTGGSAWHFCQGNNGLYRPHPREEDALSRAQHALWRRRGMEFADSSVPLNEMPNQVVGVFSTGVLEAAVRGIPAWVYAVRAPLWVEELWGRYGMKRWGSQRPTEALDIIEAEPATRIAQIVEAGA